ncbi:MAG: hypothetical protein HC898_10530 [Phycisphaerales bacterium]|nr:hypothetical protein [Phycisphaerales bacterium]
MTTRIALVSCVKHKRSVPSPARDLYQSSLFRGLRKYAEANSDAWYILSAKYGVLQPDQVVEPYERTLNKMGKADQLKWAEFVQEQLDELIPPDAMVIILAGQRYREHLIPYLRSRRIEVVVPLEGLSFGKQLHRLKEMFPC